ncbi:putative metabolite transport protein [Yarrowia sp. C11]|nr:putative metabolite transport protein [Yarrowia sp. E02]KAG5369017.1 putative metabolite transport protein [Yarrowia sp. C11]
MVFGREKDDSEGIEHVPATSDNPSDQMSDIVALNEKTSNEHQELPTIPKPEGNELANPELDPDNPLIRYSRAELLEIATQFAEDNDLADKAEAFRKGALVAQDPTGFENIDLLDDDDRYWLNREITHKWDHPMKVYYLVVCCSLAAAVQGMDETVINGANIIFPAQFDIKEEAGVVSRKSWLLGLVNSAPYLCCACISCWMTDPLNKVFGRKWTIFWTCFWAGATCFWSGFVNTWWHLFIARFFLGFGIGPKSATVPVYAAECAPPRIRGAMVMMWQMWTAFGIMMGYVMDLAFYYVKDRGSIVGLNWRLMLGSALIPALMVCILIVKCPESPRWYLARGEIRKSFESMREIRHSDVQAARDTFYAHVLLVEETEMKKGKNRFVELFTVPRNRRAAWASFIVMFMQQFCGINVIAYYSSNIFMESGFGPVQALLASFGFGAINFVFALPAVYTIDTFGRRALLLVTFPLMAIFLLFAGFCFYIGEDDPTNSPARVGCIALGIYLFSAVYSCGEGPVPFTYSAEAFPLYVRDLGMSFATAVCWLFNFVLAVTWPSLLAAFTPQGAFGWYAAWNVVGFFLVLCFLPETKNLTLEELDKVFSVPTRVHMKYQFNAFKINIERNIFRKDVPKPPPLYAHEAGVGGASHWSSKPQPNANTAEFV